MIRVLALAGLLLGAVCLGHPQDVQAKADALAVRQLKGFQAVQVDLIGEIDDKDADPASQIITEMRTTIELKLRTAGIKVVDAKADKVKGLKVVILHFDFAGKGEPSGITFSTLFYPEAVALLYDTGENCLGTIEVWHHAISSASSASQFLSSLKDEAGTYTDKFCNLFLKANPKG